MKQTRNELCNCGSDKKYKNCCGKQNTDDARFSPTTLIPIALVIVLGITVFAIIKFTLSEQDELEPYKCGDPNCDTWHYRKVSN